MMNIIIFIPLVTNENFKNEMRRYVILRYIVIHWQKILNKHVPKHMCNFLRGKVFNIFLHILYNDNPFSFRLSDLLSLEIRRRLVCGINLFLKIFLDYINGKQK